ncbi:MAG: (d)CMP kinase [Desulfobacca sp.]|uniref:(d)CMP kinase n=1 Tax=Desulfobacca sp. TaxID=2067990 RepID=UPI0040490640
MAPDGPRRVMVTLDGPAGSGKSTLAKRLARRAHLRYLESGAFYRAVAWLATQAGGDLSDPEWLAALLTATPLQVTWGQERLSLAVAGLDITQELRLPQISQNASVVATLRPVRQWVLNHLRTLGAAGGLVAEGRDMGTRVFPEAEVKIYLDASLEVRAQRRWLELQAQGQDVSAVVVHRDMAQRDQRDRERQEDPLRIPPGAHYLDSTAFTPEQMEEICLQLIQPFL